MLRGILNYDVNVNQIYQNKNKKNPQIIRVLPYSTNSIKDDENSNSEKCFKRWYE